MPKGKHVGSHHGAKIDPKMRSKFKSEKVAHQERLETVLDRSWGILDAILGVLVFAPVVAGIIFRDNSRFLHC